MHEIEEAAVLITVTLDTTGDSASTPAVDASDLSHLLRKHPAKVQTFSSPVGDIHVFYPEVSSTRTTAAMLLEVDPSDLVRSKRFKGDAGELDYYVNDRPYVASSLVAVALGTVFRSAMAGGSAERPELAAAPLPLTIEVPVVSVRGSGANDLVHSLFTPLGWEVDERPVTLDDDHPEWGDSRYIGLSLRGDVVLSQALRQLYVLLPVLDDAKHYWVSDDEADKLVRQGEGWLSAHPERDLIARRYLAHQNSLVALVDEGLAEAGPATAPTPADPAESTVEKSVTPLRILRAEAVITALHDLGAHRVIDMGAGPGALLQRLRADRSFTDILGVDVDPRSLTRAAARLHLDQASDAERDRLTLLHGSVVYRDARLRGYDAMVLMEVIEHVDESRLPALEDAVFGFARPGSVVLTTPNSDYNVRYPTLAAGAFRHEDHRFEWSREQLRAWSAEVGARHGYTVEFRPVGPVDAELGPATQMAIFTQEEA